MNNENRCGIKNLSCEKCMNYGKMFIDCCKSECGKHFYCKYCISREKYLSENSPKTNY